MCAGILCVICISTSHNDLLFFLIFFLSSIDETTDKGGENAGGHGRPSAASVSSARRLPQTAGQRLREGDQTERAGGQRRETSVWYQSGINSLVNLSFPNSSYSCFFLLQPNKLSNDLVQQFLLPDQTPPILEAEMSLRAEQLINNSKHIVPPDCQNKQETRQEVTPQPPKQQQDMRSEKSQGTPQAEREQGRIEEVKQVEETEERQEPEGRQADATITEHDRGEVRINRDL